MAHTRKALSGTYGKWKQPYQRNMRLRSSIGSLRRPSSGQNTFPKTTRLFLSNPTHSAAKFQQSMFQLRCMRHLKSSRRFIQKTHFMRSNETPDKTNAPARPANTSLLALSSNQHRAHHFPRTSPTSPPCRKRAKRCCAKKAGAKRGHTRADFDPGDRARIAAGVKPRCVRPSSSLFRG